MANDVSIAISAKDNYSQVMAKIARINASFQTDVTNTQKKLDVFSKKQVRNKA